MAQIVPKKSTPLHQAASLKETKTARGEHIYIQDCSECGSLITPRARALQDPDPSVKKLCFNCLLHKRKIRTVERRKDGWVS